MESKRDNSSYLHRQVQNQFLSSWKAVPAKILLLFPGTGLQKEHLPLSPCMVRLPSAQPADRVPINQPITLLSEPLGETSNSEYFLRTSLIGSISSRRILVASSDCCPSRSTDVYSIITRISPPDTFCPFITRISFTLPSSVALISFSIFIASRIKRISPFLT